MPSPGRATSSGREGRNHSSAPPPGRGLSAARWPVCSTDAAQVSTTPSRKARLAVIIVRFELRGRWRTRRLVRSTGSVLKRAASLTSTWRRTRRATAEVAPTTCRWATEMGASGTVGSSVARLSRRTSAKRPSCALKSCSTSDLGEPP